MHALVHKMAQRIFAALPTRLNGFMVRSAKDRIPPAVHAELGLLDMEWSLRRIRAQGWQPGTIIDVGASRGRWAAMVRGLFPDAYLLMVEANPECRDALLRAAKEIGACDVKMSLLGPEPREAVPFYQMNEGSSVLPELSDAPRTRLSLPMVRLDDLMQDHPATPPYFLKLDVQGYELDVLKGGPQTLHNSELLLMETSFLPYNEQAPLHADVVSYMHDKGFVVYDLCSTRRRASDQALFQTDLLFVKKESGLRATKPFFTP